MRIASRLYYPAVIVIILFSAVAAGAADQTIVLEAARMFDGKSDRVVSPGVVVVLGDKIRGVGPAAEIPAGARTIDLGDATLLPGFMDAHTHLSSPHMNDYRDEILNEFRKEAVERALDAGRRHRQSGKLLGSALSAPIGKSRLMQQQRAELQQMAANPSPLLLIGEPGSGREARARAGSSPTSTRPSRR